jgi:hypothetical protein
MLGEIERDREKERERVKRQVDRKMRQIESPLNVHIDSASADDDDDVKGLSKSNKK